MIEKDFAGWRTWMREVLRLRQCPLVIESCKMATQSHMEITELQKERFSLTTIAVLSMCLWASQFRNSKNAVAGKYLLEGFLQTVLPSVKYEDVDTGRLLQDHCQQCEDYGRSSNRQIGGNHARCLHCQGWMADVDKMSDEHEKILKLLYLGCALSRKCKAVARILREVLEMLTQGILEESDERGFCDDPVKGSVALHGGSRKRVVDGDLKAELQKRSSRHKA